MIQLAYDPKVLHSLTLGLMVYIPCREGQAPVLLDGRSLEMVAGRRDAYLVPSVLTRLRCGGLVKQVIGDLGKGLSWFLIFATPGDALARLESDETTHGRVKGRAYEDLAAYLRRM